MKGHLGDEQWSAVLLDSADPEASEHLRECKSCRKELGSFVAEIGKARAGILQATQQPESFWRAQRAAISTRLANHAFPQFWKRLAWVAATVVLVLVSTTLLNRRSGPPLPTVPAPSVSDDALLLSVQQSIRSDLPRALRPAALLAQEMNQGTVTRNNAQSTQPQGESR